MATSKEKQTRSRVLAVLYGALEITFLMLGLLSVGGLGTMFFVLAGATYFIDSINAFWDYFPQAGGEKTTAQDKNNALFSLFKMGFVAGVSLLAATAVGVLLLGGSASIILVAVGTALTVVGGIGAFVAGTRPEGILKEVGTLQEPEIDHQYTPPTDIVDATKLGQIMTVGMAIKKYCEEVEKTGTIITRENNTLVIKAIYSNLPTRDEYDIAKLPPGLMKIKKIAPEYKEAKEAKEDKEDKGSPQPWTFILSGDSLTAKEFGRALDQAHLTEKAEMKEPESNERTALLPRSPGGHED